MEELIKEASVILEAYRRKRDQDGLDYNIFSLMDMERNEVETHENMIFSILNYRTNSELSAEFKKQFLKSMGLPESYLNETWVVEKEYYLGERERIDIFFQTKGSNRKCVVVELKVDASDQKRQLKRYEDCARTRFKDFRIIYLTIDGREPSEQSYEGIMYPEKLFRSRSFGEHIKEWLESCIKICWERGVEASFIQQYWILIKKLTEEESVEDNIAGIIKSSNDLKACLRLVDALSIVKGQILFDFMDAIYKELKRKKCKFLYDYYECALDYCGSGSECPEFICKIADFISRNKTITLALGVTVDVYGLYFYVGYFNEKIELINNEQFKKKNQGINQRVETAISTTIGKDIKSHSYDSIIYKYILDTSNQRYDFKHFNDTCAELKDTDVLEKEAKRIAGELAYYIKEIKTML
ncbi:MAG: PD-(D/E)XK nuclease family protein [Lachnospiraceae bacterium]|nr:PD-(D/E)XK nuclease family protein [Lachnospiraceae bacterium]